MRLVSAVAAQPSARNPHEIEESSVGQPQVKWRKERILRAGGQEHGGIPDLPTPHRRPEPRQHWRDGQKKAQPIRVRLSNYGGAEEDRTPDLRIANATLSHLSYRPMPVMLNKNCRFGKGGVRDAQVGEFNHKRIRDKLVVG